MPVLCMRQGSSKGKSSTTLACCTGSMWGYLHASHIYCIAHMCRTSVPALGDKWNPNGGRRSRSMGHGNEPGYPFFTLSCVAYQCE